MELSYRGIFPLGILALVLLSGVLARPYGMPDGTRLGGAAVVVRGTRAVLIVSA